MLLARKSVTSPVGSTDYRIWERDLLDLSEAEIMKGVERAKDFTGYFDLPAFRAMCKTTPQELGLPDTRSAYDECFDGGFTLNRSWSHPAVYHAAKQTGSYEMQSMTNDDLYPLFKHNYKVLVDRVMNGESLEVPILKAIPAKIHTPLTPKQEAERFERGASVLEGLKGMFP